MNRRGFISLLTGAAGASLVPWRHQVERLIVLPPREQLITVMGGAPPDWTCKPQYQYHWQWISGGDGIVLTDTSVIVDLSRLRAA